MGPQLAVGRERGDVSGRRRASPPIHHGIDVASFPFGRAARRRPAVPRPVLARRRAPARAIEAARLAGRRLVLAGRSTPPTREHFAEAIEPQHRRRPDPLCRRGRRPPRSAQLLADAPGASVPDRVGRAVRARDDRGAGVRDAGHRASTGRACRRSSRTGVTGFVVDDVEAPGRGDRPRPRNRPPGACRRRAEERFGCRADGRRLRARRIADGHRDGDRRRQRVRWRDHRSA